jgi:uncharacterized protein YecE (DUF72 family)
MARAWVGTSGFNPQWRSVLYPEGLPQRAWLEHYAARFNSVELNVTFYRLPPSSTFAAWAARTPRDFAFVLKGSRWLTHVKRLHDPAEGVARFFTHAAPLGPKLACVLWQLPPDMALDAPRLEGFLAALRAHPRARDVRQAFEFRHPSWYAQEAFAALERAGAAVCFPDWPLQVLPPGLRRRRVETRRSVARAPLLADFVYLRRHGPGRRYATPYTPAMRRSDARWCRRWLQDGRDVLAFYNNDGQGHAVRDAASLARMVGAAPGASARPLEPAIAAQP